MDHLTLYFRAHFASGSSDALVKKFGLLTNLYKGSSERLLRKKKKKLYKEDILRY